MSPLDEFDRFDNLRREIAALPDTAPYAAWAKWFLSTDPARPIAPGFTITPEFTEMGIVRNKQQATGISWMFAAKYDL